MTAAVTMARRVSTGLTQILLWVLAVAGVSIVIVTILFWVSGLRPVVLTSGSMTPTAPVGSLLIGRQIDAADAQVGDIVTAKLSATRKVTHRVVKTAPTQTNLTDVWLKGDANAEVDPMPVRTDSVLKVQDIYSWAGFPLMELRNTTSVLILGLLLGLIMITVMSRVRNRQLGIVESNVGDTSSAELVTTLGQELRTPLTSIVGYVELLSDGEMGDLQEDQLHAIEVLRRNADRLSGLVNQVP